MFTNAIVGVGEHDGGRDAIALAQTLLEPNGELTLAHVYWGESRVWRGSNAAYDNVERARAAELPEKARDDAGIKA
jgi:hypothetical protein